jgi:predicted SAM-dependent methyltransferase
MKKLNLGCGNKKIKGMVNIDFYGNPDLKWDLNVFPYPFKKDSIDFVLCKHVLEHLKEPEKFFLEIHRILKKGGNLKIIVPHYKHFTAYCNFGHRGFYHENAIDYLINKGSDESLNVDFKLILKKVRRGKIRKWIKKEITWIIQKK